jgi:hypothetical protein
MIQLVIGLEYSQRRTRSRHNGLGPLWIQPAIGLQRNSKFKKMANPNHMNIFHGCLVYEEGAEVDMGEGESEDQG